MLYQKDLSSYALPTQGILLAEFGSIWTTPRPNEKDLILKFVICEIGKFPYENLNFFLDKLLQKLFSFYNLGTHGILQSEFGSLWTTLRPNQKDLFLKLLIWNIRNFFVWNATNQLPRFRSRPKLIYDSTQSSAHPCVPRTKLQGLDGRSSAIQSGPCLVSKVFSIGTKRSFGYSFPMSKPKTFNIVLKVW